jgi:AcrR family transcriptional regulator
MTTTTAPKPLSDRDARREAILDVAEQVFLEEGFDAASMSTIAARVGGSKGTLYNYFKSKDDLFAAYVQRHCAWQSEAMFALLGDRGDIAATLTDLGKRHLDMVLGEDNVRRFRVITAEAERAPEIGRIFYESGPQNGARRLGSFLSDAAARGELVVEDPLQAAYFFIALCSSRLHKARLCNFIPTPSADDVDREVRAAVKVFLAAYRPPSPG